MIKSLLLFIFISTLSFAQKQTLKKPTSFFPKDKTKVLVVGTFHFDYPNLDVTKTQDQDKIDVLIEPKKSEVEQLVNYIKKFKPTKIAIEATDKWKAIDRLKKYKKGEYKNQRDERFQIGMRMATELKLDTIYAIDAESMDADLTNIDSSYTNKLFKEYDFQNDDKYNLMFTDWFTYEESLPKTTNLLIYFKHLNSRESHNLGYGAYLVGDFKLDNYRGADILSIWWYNRNLRIFRKLQQMNTSTKDRILVIIGNGHASILRQLLEASPEFEFVEFSGLK